MPSRRPLVIITGRRQELPTSDTLPENTLPATVPLLAVQTLTDGATISWNAANGAAAIVTLAGNRVLANPTNLKVGASYALRVTQDATGGRTLTYGTAFKWAGSTAPVLSTAANAVDVLTFISFDGATLHGGIGKAFG